MPQTIREFIAVVLGAMLTAFGALILYWFQQGDQFRLVCESISSDVRSHIETEKERFSDIYPLFEKMKSTDALREEGGRDWLMVAVPTEFPVLNANAQQIGALGEDAAMEALSYYQETSELRAHINLLGSTAILYASGGERDKAVDRYPTLLEKWEETAVKLLSILDCS